MGNKIKNWQVRLYQIKKHGDFSYEPAVPLPGVHSKDSVSYPRNIGLSIAALFTNSEKIESSKMEWTHEWVSKTWCVCTVKFHLDVMENEIMKFVGKLVELENIALNK